MLLAMARQSFNAAPVHDAARLAEDAETLGNDLLKCFAAGLATVALRNDVALGKPSPQPRSTAVARRQAESGNIVTNIRHHLVQLNDCDRHVLRLLDGNADDDILVSQMMLLVAQKTLVIDRRTLQSYNQC
jgi:hypothetical protein